MREEPDVPPQNLASWRRQQVTSASEMDPSKLNRSEERPMNSQSGEDVRSRRNCTRTSQINDYKGPDGRQFVAGNMMPPQGIPYGHPHPWPMHGMYPGYGMMQMQPYQYSPPGMPFPMIGMQPSGVPGDPAPWPYAHPIPPIPMQMQPMSPYLPPHYSQVAPPYPPVMGFQYPVVPQPYSPVSPMRPPLNPNMHYPPSPRNIPPTMEGYSSHVHHAPRSFSKRANSSASDPAYTRGNSGALPPTSDDAISNTSSSSLTQSQPHSWSSRTGQNLFQAKAVKGRESTQPFSAPDTPSTQMNARAMTEQEPSPPSTLNSADIRTEDAVLASIQGIGHTPLQQTPQHGALLSSPDTLSTTSPKPKHPLIPSTASFSSEQEALSTSPPYEGWGPSQKEESKPTEPVEQITAPSTPDWSSSSTVPSGSTEGPDSAVDVSNSHNHVQAAEKDSLPCIPAVRPAHAASTTSISASPVLQTVPCEISDVAAEPGKLSVENAFVIEGVAESTQSFVEAQSEEAAVEKSPCQGFDKEVGNCVMRVQKEEGTASVVTKEEGTASVVTKEDSGVIIPLGLMADKAPDSKQSQETTLSLRVTEEVDDGFQLPKHHRPKRQSMPPHVPPQHQLQCGQDLRSPLQKNKNQFSRGSSGSDGSGRHVEQRQWSQQQQHHQSRYGQKGLTVSIPYSSSSSSIAVAPPIRHQPNVGSSSTPQSRVGSGGGAQGPRAPCTTSSSGTVPPAGTVLQQEQPQSRSTQSAAVGAQPEHESTKSLHSVISVLSGPDASAAAAADALTTTQEGPKSASMESVSQSRQQVLQAGKEQQVLQAGPLSPQRMTFAAALVSPAASPQMSPSTSMRRPAPAATNAGSQAGSTPLTQTTPDAVAPQAPAEATPDAVAPQAPAEATPGLAGRTDCEPTAAAVLMLPDCSAEAAVISSTTRELAQNTEGSDFIALNSHTTAAVDEAQKLSTSSDHGAAAAAAAGSLPSTPALKSWAAMAASSVASSSPSQAAGNSSMSQPRGQRQPAGSRKAAVPAQRVPGFEAAPKPTGASMILAASAIRPPPLLGTHPKPSEHKLGTAVISNVTSGGLVALKDDPEVTKMLKVQAGLPVQPSIAARPLVQPSIAAQAPVVQSTPMASLSSLASKAPMASLSSSASKDSLTKNDAASIVTASQRTEPSEEKVPLKAVAASSTAEAKAVQQAVYAEPSQAGRQAGQSSDMTLSVDNGADISKAAEESQSTLPSTKEEHNRPVEVPPIMAPSLSAVNTANGGPVGKEAEQEASRDVNEGAAAFDNPYQALMAICEEAASNTFQTSSGCPPSANAGTQKVSVAEAAKEAVKVLCTGSLAEVAALRSLSGVSASSSSCGLLAGSRLVPRGLVNTGNSCFINSILQALMASGTFCAVLMRLRTALPLLHASHYPALHGLGSLACEFKDAFSETSTEESIKGGEDVGSTPPAGADRSLPASVVVGMEGAVGWNEVGPKSKRKAGKTPRTSLPDPNLGGAGPQAWPTPAAAAALPSAVLGGKPLVPVMLSDVMRGFSPRQAAAAVAAVKAGAAAGSLIDATNMAAAARPSDKLSLAQRLKTGAAGGHEQEQEDAQEFFQFLVDRAHEEVLKLRAQHFPMPPAGATPAGAFPAQQQAPSGVSKAPSSAAPAKEEEWSQVGRKNRVAVTRLVGGASAVGSVSAGTSAAASPAAASSPLYSIFCGSMRSVVKSPGSKASATIQPFTQLHLNVHEDKITSVEAALAHNMEAERVEYKAEGSSTVTMATKTTFLHHLPEVLVLHLMRFEHLRGAALKISKSVSFDATLKLRRPLLDDAMPDCRGGVVDYKLVATVSHHGRNAAGGHYTADTLQPDGRWLRFNDAVVDVVPWDAVVAEKPYLMFYQRMR
ncbi:hypothetical protein CEUSTIGMA_g5325.t1 [Chlamydomonas eustigma]|uniref:USP domain-containing protein n=1 Tax=Chlamydomonas eustigma TaxID=1157962 RepID=A0A250X477_9CHLO|nr:hypothetical protein CEUSTIGMA_g5325.t1 [Chlamydomonas eustigma]|eukprot:GAX77883.1 hypothetical protein CEUSTIGMA_g5325.t1 [Chlamydomonas eustigma]